MAVWDPLRALIDAALSVDMATRIIVFILSLALCVIAILAFKKTKSRKFLFVTVAFLFFTGKWLLKILDLFISPGEFFNRAAENVFELVILASLFIAIFRK